jgi:hypothetical protein
VTASSRSAQKLELCPDELGWAQASGTAVLIYGAESGRKNLVSYIPALSAVETQRGVLYCGHK